MKNHKIVGKCTEISKRCDDVFISVSIGLFPLLVATDDMQVYDIRSDLVGETIAIEFDKDGELDSIYAIG